MFYHVFRTWWISWSLHLENFTLQNKQPSCCCMTTTWWKHAFLQDIPVALHLKVTKAACSIEKAVLKKFISQENIWVFNKVAGLQACSFIKRRPQHRCFFINIAKFLRALILNICERLPLKSEWIKNSSFCECSVKKQVFCKRVVLRYLIKLTGKHL